MLIFQSSKTFQTFQKKKCKPWFTELKKAVYLGSEKMSDMHIRKKTQNKTIVPHLKSNQCLALDTPQETPPGHDGERKNIKLEMWL